MGCSVRSIRTFLCFCGVMSMKISRDALEIAALFAFLTGLFVGAGLL
jgi:hypothetical protein